MRSEIRNSAKGWRVKSEGPELTFGGSGEAEEPPERRISGFVGGEDRHRDGGGGCGQGLHFRWLYGIKFFSVLVVRGKFAVVMKNLEVKMRLQYYIQVGVVVVVVSRLFRPENLIFAGYIFFRKKNKIIIIMIIKVFFFFLRQLKKVLLK